MRENVVYVDFSKKRKSKRGHKTSVSFSILNWIKSFFLSSNQNGKQKNSSFFGKRIL